MKKNLLTYALPLLAIAGILVVAIVSTTTLSVEPVYACLVGALLMLAFIVKTTPAKGSSRRIV